MLYKFDNFHEPYLDHIVDCYDIANDNLTDRDIKDLLDWADSLPQGDLMADIARADAGFMRQSVSYFKRNNLKVINNESYSNHI